MQKSMGIEAFINAVEERLRRVEDVINDPLKLQSKLEDLEQLLRNEWPDAIVKSNEGGLSPKEVEGVDKVFKKIKKLELKAKTRLLLYDGIEDFMRQPRNK